MEDAKKISWNPKTWFSKEVQSVKTIDPYADFARTGGTYRHLFSVSYNGEKNLGEIGPIKDYKLDYDALRLRSWQAYLESDIAQTVINGYDIWVIGSGLKLQAEPILSILKSEGITLDGQNFSDTVEAHFNIFRKSTSSDFSGMENLDMKASSSFKNSIVGGDVLVVLRYIDEEVKIQLIDGCHLCSPNFGTEYFPEKLPNGNLIMNGIEMTPAGKHVRYFVRTEDYKIETIEVQGKTSGLQMAYLVYGSKYRLNNVRGFPLISTVLETLKKLERYKEATVGSAEERQKIVYQIVHKEFSDGASPLQQQVTKAWNVDASSDQLPTDIQGKELANTVAASTNKETYNMPVGSEMKGLESKNELYFKDFYTINSDIICAALGIPPEVAMSKFDANFSASRAALKDWEHRLNVRRTNFAFQFYQPIFNFWLDVKILQNKIPAPGYLMARLKNNKTVLAAYRNARFVGPSVPHIDPVKEVEAERAKLGVLGAALPLTTLEAATEALNSGEGSHNMVQYASELEAAKKLKIIIPPVVPAVAPPAKEK